MSVFAAAVPFPDAPLIERAAQDLRPAAGSGAVDAGVVLPNVNDGYAGSAPDLGAYELGSPLNPFGPRTGGGGGGTGGGGGHGGCGLVGIEAVLLFFLRRRKP